MSCVSPHYLGGDARARRSGSGLGDIDLGFDTGRFAWYLLVSGSREWPWLVPIRTCAA
ncbi:hypothetical protein Val02_17900 [Virgisporangium aliadipatigenens]|uniref:Uncharacterized protein n=1 Tax=Virgisporangium aliadipatigenens TaxID=741659 RepID=A0A8J4DNX3_9ACTN|nr:hypothetical protein Val02_17900 [Virgisporangium aliadipatigenens]